MCTYIFRSVAINIYIFFNSLYIVFHFRIQDLDGGFFEKFGSLLRQKSEIAEEKVAAPLAPLAEDDISEPDHLKTIDEGEHDSGTETLQDTDSEHEDVDIGKKDVLIEDFTGWNVSSYLSIL